MRSTARSKLLWSALTVVAAVTVGLLIGCGKPAEPPTTQAPTPPAKSDYNTPATAAPSEPAKVQTAADPRNMTDLEKKHVPQFALPTAISQGKPLSVTVNVGQVAHPMKADHYIQWIELYLDGTLVKKIELKPGDKPMAEFEITPTAGAHTLKADINCNVHGLWENTMEITAK
jgi:superoxide reductase